MENQTYKILAWNLAALEEAFGKLSKKAKKLGVKAPSFKVIRYIPEFKDVLSVPSITYPARYEISVSGEFPKIPGWEFMGCVEHTALGNVLRGLPGAEIPAEYRDSKPTCDHCNTQRQRKDTFLVKNDETQELKRVGRSCLKDYLGGKSPEQIAYSATLLKTIEDMEEREHRSTSGERGIDAIQFLSYCVAAIEKYGYYVSKTKAREIDKPSTSDIALNSMYAFQKKEVEPTQEHITKALKYLEWARSIDPKSEFERNLHIICQKDLLKLRDTGFIACIPTCYDRHHDLIKKQEKAKEASNSEHFGKVGKRSEFELTFKRKVSFETRFGIQRMYFFEDQDENVCLWKTSSVGHLIDADGCYKEFQEDSSYKVRATVKEHGEYKGIKQTVLTRLQVKEP